MGLDIYVGSLTRYYAGDWELVSQKWGRETGTPVNVIRQNDPEDAIREPAVLQPLVIQWRDDLNHALRGKLRQPLVWDEALDSPYFTDKPAWDCYSDLLVWAAYAEQRNLVRPLKHVEFGEDPAYRICADSAFTSQYSHLYDVEWWLPCPFEFVFQTESLGGSPIHVGSSIKLLQQLETLNRNTWNADASLLEKWAFDGCTYGAPLEAGARFAFSLFLRLAQHSVEAKLPMLLDW